MAANGSGVNKDASATPLRLAFFDSSHADFQKDQTLDFNMNLHKIWACMGRNGVNGVMRDGLVEEGDPLNGWVAASIQEVVGGVAVGANNWNQLVAYNPLGGVNAGDYCVYGALAPFDGIMHHLAAGIAAPNYAVEFWNGAAWAALTLTVTPDFTCAGGILNQRSKWTLPTTWAATDGAGLGLIALGAPGKYYYARFRLTAGIGVAPAANTNYKDYLYGHIKHFYCHFGLKRGDDTNNAGDTPFDHPGDVILRFRDGFSLEGRSTVSGSCSWGKEVTSPAPNRPTIASGGTVICSSGKGPVVFGGLFAGVMMMGRPRHSSYSSAFALRGGIVPLDLIGVHMIGHGAPSGVPMGGAGATVVRRIYDSRFTIHPIYDEAAGIGVINPYSVSLASDGVVENFTIDVRATGNFNYAVRNSVAGQVRMVGLRITDDAIITSPTTGQIVTVGGGQVDLFNTQWGGPDNKVSVSGLVYEWKRLKLWVFQENTTTPLVGIPIRYRITSGTEWQTTLTDSNGLILLTGPGITNLSEDRFPASYWDSNISQNAEQIYDEPMTIEVNPNDLPGYNSAYMTMKVKARFGRDLLYDASSGDVTDRDWQRVDWVGTIALPLAVIGGGTIPVTAPQIPIEADGTVRIDVILPEAT